MTPEREVIIGEVNDLLAPLYEEYVSDNMQKFGVVAIDETSDWSEKYRQSCGRIFTVYFYCLDEETHCCSVTGCYFLIPIDLFCEKEISEELRDEMEAAMSSNDSIYVACNKIDALPETDGEFKLKHSDKFADQDEAMEFYRGNAMVG
jgi:hypothetical protein